MGAGVPECEIPGFHGLEAVGAVGGNRFHGIVTRVGGSAEISGPDGNIPARVEDAAQFGISNVLPEVGDCSIGEHKPLPFGIDRPRTMAELRV